MQSYQLGLTGFLALLVLIALRMPIAFALLLTGTLGVILINGADASFGILSTALYSVVASFTWTAVPLFLLMGYFAFHAGLTREAFDVASLWLNRLPGGLSMATVSACALFGACSGSGVAAAGALGRITIPEMLRHGYDRKLATGSIASAATLAVLIPPSIVLVIYAVFVQESVGRLLMAGYIPGVLSALLLMGMVYVRVKLNPSLAPLVAERITWRQRFAGLRRIWGIMVLILAVMGGIYTGFVTATEAAALGAVAALILMAVARQLTWPNFRESAFDTARTSAMLFLLIIGASVFSTFMALSGLPDRLVQLIIGADLSAYGVIAIVVAVYLFLGCFMDSTSMMLLTLPVLLPILNKLDINLVWFGILVVKLTEMGAITPPFGITVYVVKGVVGDAIPLEEIFRGIGWFLVMEFLTLLLLSFFPQISLFLPNLMLGK